MQAAVPRSPASPSIRSASGTHDRARAMHQVGPTATRHVLRGGEEILLREVATGDEALLRSLLEHVTGDSRWFRFFTGGADIDRAAADDARCDGVRRLGVLALDAAGVEVLGHGMCVPADGTAAEIAFEVADGHHRRGIGSALLAHLVVAARAAGYDELQAEVLPSNRDMRDLLTASGMELRVRTTDGVRHVRIPLGAVGATDRVGIPDPVGAPSPARVPGSTSTDGPVTG